MTGQRSASPFDDHTLRQILSDAVMVCQKVAAYADSEDRVGLATAAALLNCDLTELRLEARDTGISACGAKVGTRDEANTKSR